MDSTDNRGQWQAQGDDIGGDYHAEPWNTEVPPTKADARRQLAAISEKCTSSERRLREAACGKARKFIKRIPPEGIPGFHMKSFPVKDPPAKARRARIDLEVTTGYALRDEGFSE